MALLSVLLPRSFTSLQYTFIAVNNVAQFATGSGGQLKKPRSQKHPRILHFTADNIDTVDITTLLQPKQKKPIEGFNRVEKPIKTQPQRTDAESKAMLDEAMGIRRFRNRKVPVFVMMW